MARPSLMKAQREADRKAAAKRRVVSRAASLPACSVCGQPNAFFGFGVYSDGRPGARHACARLECRQACEA